MGGSVGKVLDPISTVAGAIPGVGKVAGPVAGYITGGPFGAASSIAGHAIQGNYGGGGGSSSGNNIYGGNTQLNVREVLRRRYPIQLPTQQPVPIAQPVISQPQNIASLPMMQQPNIREALTRNYPIQLPTQQPVPIAQPVMQQPMPEYVPQQPTVQPMQQPIAPPVMAQPQGIASLPMMQQPNIREALTRNYPSKFRRR